MSKIKYYPRPSHGWDPEILILSDAGYIIPALRSIRTLEEGEQVAKSHACRHKDELVGIRKKFITSTHYTTKPRPGRPYIHADNAALEMVDHRGGGCLEGGCSRVADRMMLAVKLAKRVRGNLTLRPSAPIHGNTMKVADRDGLVEFGCDPVHIARVDEVEEDFRVEVDPHLERTRSAGFHVHIGENKRFLKGNYSHGTSAHDRHILAKAIHTLEGQTAMTILNDIFLGLPGVIIGDSLYPEASRDRRLRLGYGQAGEFRAQPHGYEYRTLGPWPLRSPQWTWWAISTARTVALIVANVGNDLANIVPRPAVIEAINECNLSLAKELWDEARTEIKKLYSKRGAPKKRNHAMSVSHLSRLNSAMTKHKDPINCFSYYRWKDMDESMVTDLLYKEWKGTGASLFNSSPIRPSQKEV